MRSTPQQHTSLEIRIRRELHRRGLRYRVGHRLPIPEVRRSADLLFTRARVAVLLDGCWWHLCPKHATIPRTNREWWLKKLAGNVARDRDTDRRLAMAGWRVVRIWEHESSVQAAQLIERIVHGGNSG